MDRGVLLTNKTNRQYCFYITIRARDVICDGDWERQDGFRHMVSTAQGRWFICRRERRQTSALNYVECSVRKAGRMGYSEAAEKTIVAKPEETWYDVQERYEAAAEEKAAVKQFHRKRFKGKGEKEW